MIKPICSIVFMFMLELPSFAGDRTRAIDFDDEVVEGVNKRAYDSVNQVSENDRKRGRSHLYRKREEFRPETEETLREIKVWQ